MFLKLLPLVCCAAAVFGAQRASGIFPYTYSQEDLSNGLRLITVPLSFPNLVAVYIVVGTGSRDEVDPGRTGFAHLFEHLMFKGTPKYSAPKYNDAIKRMGAKSNAFTTRDFTCYYTVFSKEDLPALLAMEADRFQNLTFTEAEFKTESLAVLGEYNKNASSPFAKLDEKLLDTAFSMHPYKHTTMGFLKDIQDMPNQYEYSRKFFDRYYRPEYTTIVVAGDVKSKQVRDLVGKFWGQWQRGGYKPEIPAEPPQDGPRTGDVDWPAPTEPIVTIAFKGPAYDDAVKDTAALDALAYLAFSENSELYGRLVIKEQKADMLFASAPRQVDPSLFEITARAKKAEDLDSVRDEILGAVAAFRDQPVDAARLDAVRKHLRYSLALDMDNSESVAQILAEFVALRRSPDTLNKLFDQYAKLTPQDIQQAAAKYLVEKGRTIVTLSGKTAAPTGGGQ
jgi:zinc protease